MLIDICSYCSTCREAIMPSGLTNILNYITTEAQSKGAVQAYRQYDAILDEESIANFLVGGSFTDARWISTGSRQPPMDTAWWKR
jgi:hypothetical protein